MGLTLPPNEERGIRERKISAAKRALKDTLNSLDTDNVTLAFRAYGFDTSIEYGKKTTCKNSELLVDFEKGNASRIVDAVTSLRPYGFTPIAESLKLAGADLEPFKDNFPTILLISDGKESCDGDPITEIERLRSQGIDVQVHVVGFDLDNVARRQLVGIAHAGNGSYYDATDYRDLSDSINRVAKTVNEIATTSKQGQDSESASVPAQDPIFDILDTTGHPVAQGRVGDTITGLVPGIYTVLVHGPDSVITIEQVSVDSGEITLVEL
jgi:Ca-activated chloride channel family protein